MYYDSHYCQYRDLPINLISCYADPAFGKYPYWFILERELDKIDAFLNINMRRWS